ncbi:helix-turn-helix domain-containing protein [Actinoplanes sp. NPDC024001]|uniref:helix-turn-helix domain-containing protein n=1 Tax=Actinoplanes sp. NPDC024001 TaxID=3154598 RepID=UPI0033EF3C4F
MAGQHDSSTLGGIIRRQRELAELSLRQLAAMVGISDPYLSQIEHGLRAPSERVLHAIAASLRTTADALVEQAEPPGEGPPEVLTAIAADPNLTARQRQALGESYTAMTGMTIARRGRRTANSRRPEA